MKFFHLVLLVVIGSFSAWATPNNQQDKENSYRTELLSGKVKIIVSFEQKEYQIGDKIPLLLTIQNDSENALCYDWKGYGYEGADISVLSAPGREKVKKTTLAESLVSRRKIFNSHSYDDIPPQQKNTRVINLAKFFVISSPGDYFVSLGGFLSTYDYKTLRPTGQALKFDINKMKLKIIEKKVENTEKNKSPHPVKGDIRDSASDRKDGSPHNSN